MIHSQNELKTRSSFSDFLFYICLLSVPFVSILQRNVDYHIPHGCPNFVREACEANFLFGPMM